MTTNSSQQSEIAGRPLTDEQRYYHELSYKEPADSIGRIEEMAKFLVGAVSATSGLVLAALGLALGDARAGGGWFYAPVLLWSASVLLLVLVLLPRRYAAGQREPEAWKQALLSARAYKYSCLLTGAALFVLGLLAATALLVHGGTTST